MRIVRVPSRACGILLPLELTIVFALNAILAGSAFASGTWSGFTNQPPAGFSSCLLLTDGAVMCANGGGSGGNTWYKLTPDIHGSYRNGTWSQLASTVDTRLYDAMVVLPNGNVYVMGGEYGTGGSDARAEIYNPLTNSWSFSSTAPFTATDAIATMLPNGNVLQSNSQSTTAQYNPNTNTWSNTLGGPDTNETDWVKLADDSILELVSYGQNTSRYIPSTASWVSDASTPADLYGFGGELGSGHLLPNGHVFWIGATPNTALYTPSGTSSPGSWTAGPAIPNSLGAVDAPAAMMANGNVLCALGVSTGFGSATDFYEYDYLTNSFSEVNAPNGSSTDGTAPYTTSMLDLPDGTVLYQGTGLYVYTPNGSPVSSGVPVIQSVSKNSNGSYHLTGTGLNGISEGAKYGDDKQMNTNYPIVRLTSNSTGDVYYARTLNWSSTSVMTGSKVLSTDFTLPSGLPLGSYALVEVGDGIPSASVTFLNGVVPPTPTGLTATAGNAQVAMSWTNSSGATSYNIYRATAPGGEGTTPIATASSTSYTNTGLTNGTTYYYKVAAVDASGTSGQSAEASATPSGGTTGAISIACGNSAVGSFVADTDFSGGAASSGTTSAINTSEVVSPAPAAVYQHGRKGTCTYTIPGLTAGASYDVRLDFCEYAVTGAGQRTFDVSVNGTQVLTNFDIYAAAGGEFIANAQNFTATANSSGQIVIVFTTVLNNALVAGIEVKPATSVIKIAAGNSAQGTFVADTDFSGGAASSGTASTINTSTVTDPAPMAVYQHGRKGNCTYTIGGLTAGATYTVRLDFCEYIYNAAGQRTFNVILNGTQVLTNYDIFANAGEFNANAQGFTATANSSGQITIQFVTVINDALVGGIEVSK